MVDQDLQPHPSLSLECEAAADGIACDHPAHYIVSLEEEGHEGSGVLATRHVCAEHLAFAADWALTRPTPYAGEAEDVYLTLHERRITIGSFTSSGSTGGSVSFQSAGDEQGAFSIT